VAVLSTDKVVISVFLNARERVSIFTYESNEESGELHQTGTIDIPHIDVRALINALRALRPFAAK
jgi:hypothetical protein